MKVFELFGLNDDEDENRPSKKKFDAVVKDRFTKFCHESPAGWRSFVKSGITDETVFCTVNQVSNFVTGEKTRIWFKLPTNRNIMVTPDMRYESYDQVLEEHPKITGADVAVNSNVPLAWIFKISSVDANGREVTQWTPD